MTDPAAATGGAASPLYGALRRATRAALHVFYNRIEATGLEGLEGAGPTILAPTHPNSIIDPLLVGLFETRQISFVARHGLFAVPLFGPLLRRVGAIPVRRRSDGGGDNSDAFAECRRVLAGGGVLTIFPEGKTHSRLRVEPIKTGVARIALDAETRGDDPLGLRVVPVGLNYLVRHAFRSDVHVAFGAPIEIGEELRTLAAEDERAAVRELTERVQRSLEELTIHIEEAEDERIVAQVTSIVVGVRAEEGLDAGGQSPAERVALAQRVVDATRWLGELEPARTASLRSRIEAFVEEREALRLGGERPALQHRGERRVLRRRLLGRRGLSLLFGAPFAAAGLLGSVVPYLLLRAVLWVARPTFYRAALIKILGGALIFGLCYAAQIALAAFSLGALAAVLVGLALVPTGLFARRYLSELRLHRLGPRFVLRRLWHRTRIAALHAERVELTAELVELRKRYLEAQR